MLDIDVALRMEREQSSTTLKSKRIFDLENELSSTTQNKYNEPFLGCLTLGLNRPWICIADNYG